MSGRTLAKTWYYHTNQKKYIRNSTNKRIIIFIMSICIIVFCHRPFLPGTSRETETIPTAQALSFILQYFLYYV
jgi:hypothetical protein